VRTFFKQATHPQTVPFAYVFASQQHVSLLEELPHGVAHDDIRDEQETSRQQAEYYKLQPIVKIVPSAKTIRMPSGRAFGRRLNWREECRVLQDATRQSGPEEKVSR